MLWNACIIMLFTGENGGGVESLVEVQEGLPGKPKRTSHRPRKLLVWIYILIIFFGLRTFNISLLSNQFDRPPRQLQMSSI